jgi:hypothetical protein
MKTVSDSINSIRSHGLNHRQFKKFIEHTDTPHSDLIYYSEVRWLSRGEALKRFNDLIDEIISFLEEKGKQTGMLKEPSFKCNLEFLVNVTAHLNDLNKKIDGKKRIHQSTGQCCICVQTKTPTVLKWNLLIYKLPTYASQGSVIYTFSTFINLYLPNFGI